MQQYDERVDAYIAKAAEFARPILTHLRKLVHQASPQVTETIKWGFPVFEYKGPLCNMAAFKQHCAFGLWKASLLNDEHHLLNDQQAMGHLGRITALSDLPADAILLQYLHQAIELNEKGIKKAKPTIPKTEKKELEVPQYFIDFLAQHPNALHHFDNFSYSNRKEYVEWITEAKTEATRQKRMQTAAEWLAEGKSRNWKYQR